MKKSKFYAMALLMPAALISTTSCTENDGPYSESSQVTCPVDPTTTNIINTAKKHSFSLFSEVDATEKPNENICISPLSVTELLTMISNGANGETLNQIDNILGTSNSDRVRVNEALKSLNNWFTYCDSQTTVHTAFSQWINKGFEVKLDYITNNAKWLRAETYEQPLSTIATKDDINKWCSYNTNGCIKEFLKVPLSSDCKMALFNALYFKGMWKYKFDKSNTSEKEFTNLDGSKPMVQMMHQSTTLPTYTGEKIDMVEFPYGKDIYCMDIILPHEDQSLEECMKDVNMTTFSKWLDESRDIAVDVSMPRMELRYGVKLNEPLMAMGMTDAFSPTSADFSGISDNPLFISIIKQETYIKIDEEGTEAAAVTGTIKFESSTPTSNLFSFNINRPFAYIIRDKSTGMILFIGRVVKL